jgi:acetyltransferase-like isoleucine patch superfamily enzyme
MTEVLRVLINNISKIYMSLKKVSFSSVVLNGFPYIRNNGRIIIGPKTIINSGYRFNPVYNIAKTMFITLHETSELIIGENVGISNCVIYCTRKIIIENDVMIGAGVKIYDTDFHQIDPVHRKNDYGIIKSGPITIKSNAFIGAGSIILKGVTIGSGSVIGANSVVYKNIPDSEIWAGNPIKYISKVDKLSN